MAKRVRRRSSKAKADARKAAEAGETAQAEQKAEAGGPNQQRIFREFVNAFGGSHEMADAISQMLVVSVGAVPSVAVAGSMLAANAAEGLMYYNAVAHQQKTNLLGMAMTAKCVRYMLDGRSDDADPDLDGLVDDIIGEAIVEDAAEKQ